MRGIIQTPALIRTVNNATHNWEADFRQMSSTENITIARATFDAAARLRESGITEARREAGSLLAHILGCDRTFLITHADKSLTSNQLTAFYEMVARRARRVPLQYITGHQEFYGLEFEVTPAVLIPRPETELVVDVALEQLKNVAVPCVCDVGTGSGCISIALLHLRPDARAVASDISPQALAVAKLNAAHHKVANRFQLIAADGLTAFRGNDHHHHHRFAVIVSNPPYIPLADVAELQPEVRDYEPRAALTPGADGLQLVRRLLESAAELLIANGCLIFEIGFDQATNVREMIDGRVWTLLDIHRDLQGIPRTVALRRK